MKRRFDTYFPWLFTAGDLFACLLSLSVANFFLQRFHVLGETEFSAYLPLALLWILISILRKDYKIGRTEEYEDTLRLYEPFNKIFRKDLQLKNDSMAKQFKTKLE